MDIAQKTAQHASKTTPLKTSKTGRSLCAKLRSRNAHGHLRRELLFKNLQPNGRRSDGAPCSNPGPLAPTVRTPQSHCLENFP